MKSLAKYILNYAKNKLFELKEICFTLKTSIITYGIICGR